MLKRYSLVFFCLFLSSYCFADTCPCPTDATNFNLIQPGDSLEHIKQLCCAPLSEKTSTKLDTLFSGDWKYFPAVGGAPGSPPSGSIQLVVSFIQDKVVNISVMAQSMTSTSLCNTGPVGPGATASTIKIGDSTKTVESICGKGLVVPSSTTANGDAKKINVTTLQYSGPPPTTLTFENGILKDIQQTQQTDTSSAASAAIGVAGQSAGVIAGKGGAQ